MEPDKQLVNVHFPRRTQGPLLIAALIRSARRATPDGSEEKSFVPVLLCFRCIPISSSARMPGAGNGDYRGELQRAIGMSRSYATHLGISPASILVRLDGLYGDAAPLLDVLSANLTVIVRSRAYHPALSGRGETSPGTCS